MNYKNISKIKSDINHLLNIIEENLAQKRRYWQKTDSEFLRQWEAYSKIRNNLIDLEPKIFSDLREIPVPETRDQNFVTKDLYDINDLLPLRNEMKRVSEYFEYHFKDDKNATSLEDEDFNQNVWENIRVDFGISKNVFGKKIHFIKDKFTRDIIFRDIEQAYVLYKKDFNKPSVLLAGGVIEELLRHYLIFKGFKSKDSTFNEYIKACEEHGLLKTAIRQLSDSVRYFRNLVHISMEKSPKYTISKATAMGAVSIIFTISNDFD